MRKNWSNEIGKKYGHLTIVEILNYTQPGDGIVCRAICDCPMQKEVIVPIKRIVRGRKISCGCSKCVNLMGERFGRLTVIEKMETRYKRQVEWKCKCDCGNEVVVASDSLRRGMTRSCGCLGAEVRAENIAGLKKNIVMGTNLAVISRDDHNPMATNTSGHTGVSYNPERKLYEARLKFQCQSYVSRHFTFEEAVASRTKMKQIHNDFVDWWNSLDVDQQVANRLAYAQMVEGETHCLKRDHNRQICESRKEASDKGASSQG